MYQTWSIIGRLGYTMYISVIIALIYYACNYMYSAGQYAVHWRIDLLSILVLRISKPHLVQAGRIVRDKG